MKAEELYPELIDYIYENAREFITITEKLAGKTILYNSKGLNEKTLQFIKQKGWYSDSQEIQALIAGGYEAFKKKIVERIYKEHKDELNLNFCPRCGKITRTPLARQCRFCFHQWHSAK